MMTNDESTYALPKLHIDIARLEVHLGHLRDRQELMDKQLSDIVHILSEAKGGWRTLMWVGGACSVASGALAWLATHITWKGFS